LIGIAFGKSTELQPEPLKRELRGCWSRWRLRKIRILARRECGVHEISAQIVGQPIVAAAAFQAAFHGTGLSGYLLDTTRALLTAVPDIGMPLAEMLETT
jgi:hypothetical protein